MPDTHTPDIQRPPKEIVDGLRHIGSATAAGELKRLGIRDPHIQGPVAFTPGKSVVGPALTLQFMPQREDVYRADEYADPEKQLHRHCLYHTRPGDVVVVDARGSMDSGVFGNMMLTFFQGRGGIGVVIDGCIRDFPIVQRDLDLGLWLKGVTPNFHTQTTIYPYAVNVPIACSDAGARAGREGPQPRRVGGLQPHEAAAGGSPEEVLPPVGGGAAGVRGVEEGPGPVAAPAAPRAYPVRARQVPSGLFST